MMRRRNALAAVGAAAVAALLPGRVAAQSCVTASGQPCGPRRNAVAQAPQPAPMSEAAQDFYTAIMRDNYKDVMTWLLRGFNPNTPDDRGRTPLTLAMRQDSWRVVDTLLQSPATDVNLPNRQNETPLMMAAIKGNLEVVKKLVARKADVNREGWTPLHYAASAGLEHSVEIAAYLLEHHAYIDATSPNGSTPLMLAAQYSSEGMVNLLLKEGADVMLRNQQGWGALEFAQKSERDFMVKLIGEHLRKGRATPGKKASW